jgi:hypothetical protein
MPSPIHDAKKFKPQIRLRETKIAPKEIDVKKEILSLKEPEVTAKETPEEKAAPVAEPKEILKEETPVEEKEELVAKKEDIETSREEPVQLAKVTEELKTEKKAEPKKEDILQYTRTPAPEVMETKEPAEIEEPVKDIPLDEKPEADVPAIREGPLTEKTPSQKIVSTPVDNKVAGLQEIEKGLTEKRNVEGEKEPTLRAATEKKEGFPAKGLKEETLNSKGKGEPESKGSTHEPTTTSSKGGYSSIQNEGKQQAITQTQQGSEGKAIVEEKGHGMGIPISEVLVPVDLKIEVFLRKPSSIHSTKSQALKVTVPEPASEQKNMLKATEITKISIEEFNGGFKVLIKGNGSMNPKIFSLDKNRIVMDFHKTAMKAQLPSKVVSHLKEIRSGKHKDKSRLVLELDDKLPFDFLSSGDTVVVTVLKSDNKPPPALPPVEQKAPEIIESKELKEADISGISTRLLKNAHPMSNSKEKQAEVTLLQGKKETHSGDTLVVKKTFSVLRTAEGAYTFAIQNQENETFAADIAFFIFPGKKGEKKKKYAAVALSPHTTVRFKFILPEGIFWDDEEYFSGKIENSETMTKYNKQTGIVWKETKDE